MANGASGPGGARLRARAALLLAACLAGTGCALSSPPLEQVLAAATRPGTDTRPGEAIDPLAELDRLAAAAVERARAAPHDPDAARAAAQRLFQAADLRLQRAVVARLDALAARSIDVVLLAEDELQEGVRTEILALCRAGRELAEHALEEREDDVAVRLQVALHVSLIAWANGPTRSLFAGLGPKLSNSIAAAVQIDPEHDHAAPLRLEGRFLAKAPWPYGDAAKARRSLTRAVEVAPLVVNHLFLGDALYSSGQTEAAVAQWRLASTAADDESTRWSAPLQRELARRRLQALGR